MLFEVCVDDLAGVLAARQGGAQRVELCSALHDGGLTPSAGLVQLACRQGGIGVQVLLRPRGGDFVYSEAEVQTLLADLAFCQQVGATGVVLGALTPAGKVDVGVMSRLMEGARGLPVTFHRAFDLVPDPARALDTLIDLGIGRVLTSGQRATAWEGREVLRELVQQAAGRITVLAGGGIRAHNVRALIAHTGVTEVHFTARQPVPPMPCPPELDLGVSFREGRQVTDGQLVQQLIKAAQQL